MTNQTDKELLELAAKAAGYKEFDGHAEQMVESGWNPLTDDGDALRLAVKLEMDIQQYKFSVEANAWFDGECIEVISEEIIGQGTADYRLLATRRAIVRAAAAIGGKL